MDIVDGRAETLADLSRALRGLRRRDAREHGQAELTYRELARKTGWSVGIIGAYFAGKVLPPTDRFDILVMLLGASPAERGMLATARDRIAEHRYARTAPPAAGRSGAVPAGRAVPMPNQLPADVYGFVGRADEFAELDRLLPDVDPPARVATVSGTAGVGKTALAVHWAHRVVDRFPDGQLYVNLRGFDPGAAPVTPDVAVRGFLIALDVPVQRIPADPDEQAALYRSLLARKRVLIVLDNSRDAAQVRPLLPGAPSSVVVVTSRHRLTGLTATDGAHPVDLRELSPAEARELLTYRLGAARVGTEPAAVDEIISRCDRLPLALAVVAARAATDRRLTLARLADELAEAGRRLDVLEVGDAAADVRAVFSWSYRALQPAAARLFRLLGLHPGPDIAVTAAASLAGVPASDATRQLADLTYANLATEHVPGRYAVHDLLRGYAIEQARAYDGDDQRRAAVQRLLDHYARTGHRAASLLDPVHEVDSVGPARPGVADQLFAGHREALAWLTAEHRVLLNLVTLAVDLNFDEYACNLAWVAGVFGKVRGHWADWAASQEAALPAAYRLADRVWQARTHRTLANAYARLHRYEDSEAHSHHALDRYGALGDEIGMARTHRGLCLTLELQRRYPEALAHARRSRDLLLGTEDHAGQAYAYNSVGWYHALIGDFPEALDNCRRAITLLRQVGDRRGEATAWDSLGYAHHHLGQFQQALACYDRAITTFQDLGDRFFEADTLDHIGDTYEALGEHDAAEGSWQRALSGFEELGCSEADEVRTKLGKGRH
ncbi:ATP-binding protein [Paractinoplanes rishiriensis]|uniref:HTH cro/C1-type domain-containing protein n=1 Tax=Paractinoplanes rishiriensis TaxID=1050105 RepID=A0A919JSS1_9ACTN|nr:helix-turn-helix domain-containing protein [Actinoplanes rishiriensis]GIE94501.1 hypothetical protein Ari01nite_19660 [Actinoplanes rishiriensis]